MRIVHRIAFNATPEQHQQMLSLGFPAKVAPNASLPGDLPLVAFDAYEDHPGWPVLAVLLKQWKHDLHVVWTEFTPREIESARWLTLHAWNNGFPQPQDVNEYRRVTFDLTRACPTCAFGEVQNAPFRLKGEPKWNRRGIMTTFWTHEEFFVPPAVWETVFKPFGTECRSVANAKGTLLKTVVQLVAKEEIDIVTDGLKPIPCTSCRRTHYEWPVRGPFPALVQEPVGAMARSRQGFGTGYPYRAVFISQELARAFKAHNLRGATFVPVDHALPAVIA